MTQKVYTTRDLAPLSRTVVACLRLYLSGCVAMGLSAAAHVVGLKDFEPSAAYSVTDSLPGQEGVDAVMGMIALVYLVIFVTTIVLVSKWIYRASRNAHAVGAGLTISPPWSVGWFFIPVANLWKPFQAMRETWQVSSQPDAWRSVATPSLLRWWWGLWIVSNILGNLSFRLSTKIHTVAGAIASDYVDVLSAVIEVPLALALIRIVTRITDLQARNINNDIFG